MTIPQYFKAWLFPAAGAAARAGRGHGVRPPKPWVVFLTLTERWGEWRRLSDIVPRADEIEAAKP